MMGSGYGCGFGGFGGTGGYGGFGGFGGPMSMVGGIFGIIIHLALVILVIMVLVWLFKFFFRNGALSFPGGNTTGSFGASHEGNALEIAKSRFAKGEITAEEFRSIKEELLKE